MIHRDDFIIALAFNAIDREITNPSYNPT